MTRSLLAREFLCVGADGSADLAGGLRDAVDLAAQPSWALEPADAESIRAELLAHLLGG